jgi:hypothetical protein
MATLSSVIKTSREIDEALRQTVIDGGASSNAAIAAAVNDAISSNIFSAVSSIAANVNIGNITLGGIQQFLTTSNVTELNNLYFTNARVVSALVAGDSIVIEANGRISANLSFLSNITSSGTANITLTGLQPFLTTANVNENFISGNLYFTYARANAAVWPSLTTANVIERAGNLYFTNSRVVSALIAGNNITIEANGRISANVNVTASGTANITLAGLQPFLTTANVLESSSNLYFTNTRVVSALIAGTNITIEANGRISTTANITASGTANITLVGLQPFLTTANVLESSSNLYFTNSRVVSALIAGNNITIEANGRISTTANITASGTANITLAGLQPFLTAANITNFNSNVNVVVQSFLTTANVAERSGNLYFTNSRVLSYITSTTLPGSIRITETLFANTIAANNIITGTGSGGTISGVDTLSATNVNSSNISATVWIGLYSGNVVESTNQYFTNSRVVSALIAGNQITIEANGRISANVNVTASGIANITLAGLQPFLTAANITNFNSNVTVVVQPFLTAANITNFNSNVTVVVQPFLTAANITNFNSNVNVVVQSFLTTANVAERSGNLYFTNSRVVSALIAGTNITIEANGRISTTASTSADSIHPFLLSLL